MNEPLASAAGNAVEVADARRFPDRPCHATERLREVTLALAAEMLQSAGLVAVPTRTAMRVPPKRCRAAARRTPSARMVAALGGPADFLAAQRRIPAAGAGRAARCRRSRAGFVTGIATRDIGLAVVRWAAAAARPDDGIDHAVGLTRLLPIGDPVERGEPLALVHGRSEAEAERAAAAVAAAYAVGDTKPAPAKAIVRRIRAPR